MGQGTLEIPHRSVCRRDVAPHGDLVHLRTGHAVDRQRLRQVRERGAVGATLQVEQADVVEHGGATDPVLQGAIEYDRLVIMKGGARIVALQAREIPKVDQVDRGGLVPPRAAIRRQCFGKRPVRVVEVTQALGHQAEVVSVSRRTTVVTRQRSNRRRAGIQLG